MQQGHGLLFFFLFFSLWSFVTSVLTFSSHKLFFKTYLSVKFVLLSINRQCVLCPSLVEHLGLHWKWNLCFERFPAGKLELCELFPLHVLLLCKEEPRKLLALIFFSCLREGLCGATCSEPAPADWLPASRRDESATLYSEWHIQTKIGVKEPYLSFPFPPEVIQGDNPTCVCGLSRVSWMFNIGLGVVTSSFGFWICLELVWYLYALVLVLEVNPEFVQALWVWGTGC